MDRLIWTAWRAFWVGLGASLVLIAQSLIATPAHTPADTNAAADASSCPSPTPRAPRDALPTMQLRTRVPLGAQGES